MLRLPYVSFLGRANFGRPSESPNVHSTVHTRLSAGSSGNRESAYLRYERQHRGAIAQLGERWLCKPEVAGSIPAGSIEKH